MKGGFVCGRNLVIVWNDFCLGVVNILLMVVYLVVVTIVNLDGLAVMVKTLSSFFFLQIYPFILPVGHRRFFIHTLTLIMNCMMSISSHLIEFRINIVNRLIDLNLFFFNLSKMVSPFVVTLVVMTPDCLLCLLLNSLSS